MAEEMAKTEDKSPVLEFIEKNWILLAVLLFAVVFRLHYFTLTEHQPLWWDESEYMAAAKAYAGKAVYELSSIRFPGFPLLMSTYFMLGIDSEPFMRFTALLIPSLLVILLIYLVIKEMYPDKRIALISTAIMAVLWEHVFYSNRFHTENFALLFELLAFYFLFKGYVKKQKILLVEPKFSLIAVSLLSVLAVLFRPGNAPFIPAVLLFIIILNKSNLFTRKKLLIYGISIIAITAALLFLSTTQIFKDVIRVYFHPTSPIAFSVFSSFYGFYESVVPAIPSVLYYAFLFGIFVVIVDLIMNLGKVKTIQINPDNIGLKSDIFNLLLMLSVLFVFAVIIRTESFEFRWFFPLITGMLAFTGKGIVTFSDYLAEFIKTKKIAVLMILLILGAGMYTQAVHADEVVKAKVDSYSQVRDAALWMKDNSQKGDVILSISTPQTAYYSEREVIPYADAAQNETAFDELISRIHPKYLTISVFEPHPEWVYDWPKYNNETVKPVHVYFADKDQKQALLVIYEIKY